MPIGITWTVLSFCLIFHLQGAMTRFAEDITRIHSVSQNNVKNGNNSTFNVVCYFGMPTSPYNGTLPPALNVTFCSHIIFEACTFDSNGEICPSNPEDISWSYSKVPVIKKIKPSVKVLISNVGTVERDFSNILGSSQNRTRFAKSVAPFLRKYGFDGLDLDWEFPVYVPFEHHFLPEQKHNFSLLLEELMQTLEAEAKEHGTERLLLSVAVAGLEIVMDMSYEIPYLAKNLDFINLMTYDIHMFLDITPFTGFNSPLYPGKDTLDETIFKTFNMAWAANEWVKRGMNLSQIMVGIPLYGHTYTLLDKNWHSVYAPATAPGKMGSWIAYAATCQVLHNSSTVVVWDNSSLVPYAYLDGLWISYDNERSVIEKAKYSKSHGFGGVMTFNLNSDDYVGSCDGKTKWPLHKAIVKALTEN